MDERALTFFVSGALLAGAAACSKTKKDDERTANPGPVPVEQPVGSEAIDAGPTGGVDDTQVDPTETVNEGPMPDAGVPTEVKEEKPLHKTNAGPARQKPHVNPGPVKPTPGTPDI